MTKEELQVLSEKTAETLRNEMGDGGTAVVILVARDGSYAWGYRSESGPAKKIEQAFAEIRLRTVEYPVPGKP